MPCWTQYQGKFVLGEHEIGDDGGIAIGQPVADEDGRASGRRQRLHDGRLARRAAVNAGLVRERKSRPPRLVRRRLEVTRANFDALKRRCRAAGARLSIRPMQ